MSPCLCRPEVIDCRSTRSPRGQHTQATRRSDDARRLGISRPPSACVGNEWIETTRPAISYHNHLQHRFGINMDNVQDSLPGFKKVTKRRFGRSKQKGNKPGPGGHGESVGSSTSFVQPEPRVSMGGGRGREGGGPDTENENAERSAVAVENRPDWKSTASSSAKLVLRAVRDSADAFGPLKSVAGGLCFILENCEV